jgi:tRNA (guanine-N7-)-methyltransferase
LLLQLCDELELRCNWAIYAEEFQLALRWSNWRVEACELKCDPEETITAFERKYVASGHALYQVRAWPDASG